VAYEAGKSQHTNIRAQALQIQKRLKTASLTLEDVMKKLDFLFGTPDASGPYNLDSYVNQIFEDFGKTQKELGQASKEFKMILKTLEEKGNR
jgi:DNA anti-recombination protein RmuC